MSGIPSREEAFFAEAITQPTADRGLFVAQKCGADAALLARIAELLVAHAAGPDYLFNQVQTARALSSRAEISSDVSAKRGWLMSAACYLRRLPPPANSRDTSVKSCSPASRNNSPNCRPVE